MKEVTVKSVKLKSLEKLKPFARHLGGDQNGSLHYFVRMGTKEPISNLEEPNCIDGAFMASGYHVLEHGKEFLVVDHPNLISKREYEMLQELFEETEEDRSMKGVC